MLLQKRKHRLLQTTQCWLHVMHTIAKAKMHYPVKLEHDGAPIQQAAYHTLANMPNSLQPSE